MTDPERAPEDRAGGAELPSIVVPPPGPRSRALAERMAAVESPAFDARREARERVSGEDHAPIVYARGIGANVLDVDGNRYVDLTAGFGALLLGYGPNPATEAASAATNELTLALGDVYASEIKVRACEAIAALHPSPGARVMLGLSGADAVTCALKTALLATGKPGVVAFEGSYHGLSYGPLAALGFAPGFREPFAPHLGVPVTFAPYPARSEELDASLTAVRAAVARGDVGAILVEPVLGRGGCIVPPDAFLRELRAIATETGVLLVADEIWTGLGRSGAMLACTPVVPDVLCLGKGLGGGLPISACVGSADVMAAWGGHGGTRIHTGTHFGSPPACAAALATLEAIAGASDSSSGPRTASSSASDASAWGAGSSTRAPGSRLVPAADALRVGGLPLAGDDLAARAHSLGAAWRSELDALGVEVRGRGLMVGVQLADAGTALATARAMLAAGYIVLTGGARGDVLTLSPALTIAPALLTAFAHALAASRR